MFRLFTKLGPLFIIHEKFWRQLRGGKEKKKKLRRALLVSRHDGAGFFTRVPALPPKREKIIHHQVKFRIYFTQVCWRFNAAWGEVDECGGCASLSSHCALLVSPHSHACRTYIFLHHPSPRRRGIPHQPSARLNDRKYRFIPGFHVFARRQDPWAGS